MTKSNKPVPLAIPIILVSNNEEYKDYDVMHDAYLTMIEADIWFCNHIDERDDVIAYLTIVEAAVLVVL